MARLNAEQYEKFSNSNSGQWFKLEDDGDSAKVQFFAKSTEDLDVFSVHKIMLGGKERFVDCLRTYDDPIDVCPFCAAGMRATPTMIISMYNHTTGETNIWTRGRKFKKQLDTLYNEYGEDTSNTVFKIIRCGKKGSTDTTYQILPQRDEPINLDEMERPKVLGSVILEKTANEMDYYLVQNDFPSTEKENNNSAPSSRREVEAAPAPRSRRGF